MRQSFFLILAMNVLFSASAQDGHYWTQQYGTRSILLGNAVIGGSDDLGALYYNPGRLPIISNRAFLLNVDVYELNRYKYEDVAGTNADRTSSKFGGVPSFAAGSFNVGFLPGHYFGYSILIRQKLDLDFNYKDDTYGDVIENFPGEEYFSGQVRFNQKLKDDWYTLTWAYPINEKLSIGVNTTVAMNEVSKSSNIALQAFTESNNTAIYSLFRKHSYDNIGLLWKIGVAGIAEKFDWGVTVTTPAINITKKADLVIEEYFSGIEGVSEVSDKYTSFQEDNMELTYKRPFSIAAGASIPIGKGKIHVSSEYYTGISNYTLYQTKEFTSQSSGDTLQFTISDKLNGVINAGAGFEYNFSEKVSTFASFSTDFSAVPGERPFVQSESLIYNSIFRANYYHITAGTVLKLKGADITLGASFTSGKEKFRRPIDFPEEDDDPIFESEETGSLLWQRWRIIFSFSFPLLEEKLKGIGNGN